MPTRISGPLSRGPESSSNTKTMDKPAFLDVHDGPSLCEALYFLCRETAPAPTDAINCLMTVIALIVLSEEGNSHVEFERLKLVIEGLQKNEWPDWMQEQADTIH